jgi:hypothetical protein
MNIPYQELQKAGVDIAGIVTEDFLNKFSDAHFRHVPDIYTGSQRFTNFDNDIEIAYNFTHAVVFDLDPISATRFKRIWCSHLQTKGASSLKIDQIFAVPANLALEADKIKFTITGYDGHTNNVILKIDFTWKLEARCAVSFRSGLLTLEPIKIEFSPASIHLVQVIRKKLARLSRKRELSICGVIGSPNDPVWCAKAEQFILFLLNSVLSTQMTNFVRAWRLPISINLFDGIAFSPNYLSIHDDMLVLGGQVTSAPVGVSPIQHQIDALLLEFSQRVNDEFSDIDDASIKKWAPHKSPTVKWINGVVKDLQNQVKQERRRRGGGRRVTSTLALCSNDKIFDLLAKKYLSANQSWSGGSEIDHIVKADIGWWFRVENAAGKVIPKGIQVSARASVGGSASICYFNLDPKHFGDWACNSLSVALKLQPDPPGFALNGYPLFASDGVYVRADLLTQSVGLQIPGWPGWANDILGWVTGMLTVPLLAAIKAVVALLRIRIAQYPKFFPGTGLEWIPNMSTTPDNAGPYLVFSLAPTFK